MSQTALVIQALKRHLKLKGVTYAELADALNISEASVKRVFAEQKFTLERLEQICQHIDLSLTELFQSIDHLTTPVQQLTEEQEYTLVSDPKLLLVTYLVLNDWCLADICQDYTIEYHECIQLLAKLDRLKIIDLHPNNRIKLRIAPTVQWLPNGPIAHYFQQQIKDEFLHQSNFSDAGHITFLPAMLSSASIKLLEKKMQLICKEFNELIRMDARLPREERHGYSLLIALSQWEFSAFKHFKRQTEI